MKTTAQYIEDLENSITIERVFAKAIIERSLQRAGQAEGAVIADDILIREAQAAVDAFYSDSNNNRLVLANDPVLVIGRMLLVDGTANRTVKVIVQPPYLEPIVPALDGALYVANFFNARWFTRKGPDGAAVTVVYEVTPSRIMTHVVDTAAEAEEHPSDNVRKALAIAEIIARYPANTPVIN